MNNTTQLYRIQEQVLFYQNCFWVCLAGVILFLGLAIFLSIYFNIPAIFTERFGIKRKRILRQMDRDVSVNGLPYHYKKMENFSNKEYESMDKTMQTFSDETMLLTEDVFIMEKDIIMSGMGNGQNKSKAN